MSTSQKRNAVIRSISFAPEVLARLDAYAEKLRQSRSSLINQIIRAALGLPPATEQIQEEGNNEAAD